MKKKVTTKDINQKLVYIYLFGFCFNEYVFQRNQFKREIER